MMRLFGVIAFLSGERNMSTSGHCYSRLLSVFTFSLVAAAASVARATDTDHDGIDDSVDNCPLVYNPSQLDRDHDGVGDACDFCPITWDPTNTDTDGDQVGDVCDNCPYVYNPDQADSDIDNIGDACDDCPTDPNKSVRGACGCGTSDVDSDQDGIPDCADNCPSLANGNQVDADHDGIGDACDNCPSRWNPTQIDSNHNGKGDACDPIRGPQAITDGSPAKPPRDDIHEDAGCGAGAAMPIGTLMLGLIGSSGLRRRKSRDV